MLEHPRGAVNLREQVDMEKTTRCRVCGEDFTYEHIGGRMRLYCNAVCRQRAEEVVLASCTVCGGSVRKRRVSEKPAVCAECRPKKVARACVTCGTMYETWPSQRKKFCSPECRRGVRPLFEVRQVRCRICTGVFEARHPGQKWCTTCVPGRTDRARARRYGISYSELAELKAKYDGKCWICRENDGECVDHDHETGKVRGYLCRGCNMALHFVERSDWWEAATTYLRG